MKTRSTLAGATALAAGLSLVLAGCDGDSQPAATRTHLRLEKGDTRLLVLPEQSLAKRTERVTLPTASDQLLLRADCRGGANGSTMKIQVSSEGDGDVGYGGGAFGCTRTAGAGGLVILGDETESLAPGEYRITITAPRGATWSAAVDTD